MTRVDASRAAVVRLAVCALAAVATVAGGAVPARAEPSPAQIEAQIDKQWNALEPTIEQYNQVHSQLRTSRAQVKKLNERLEPLQRQIEAAMGSVRSMATRAYMNGRPSALDAVLSEGSPTGLADKLTSLDQLARRQREAVSDVTVLRDRYAADKKALDTITAGLATRDADLAARRKQIEKKIDELQKLRIRAYGGNGESAGALRTGPCPAVYTNDRGGRAAKKACSLIGKPYIFGSAGPNGYDCSGLTMTAWASVGVSLRHYTKWQWSDASPVSRADLKPGDLVFYYSDLHHMGIYVGGGQIVHAPHTGDRVRMAPIDRSPVAGYRRPG
ncbi:MAG TPA: NlpC/P60 family protein [Actinoplanes sp.]